MSKKIFNKKGCTERNTFIIGAIESSLQESSKATCRAAGRPNLKKGR